MKIHRSAFSGAPGIAMGKAVAHMPPASESSWPFDSSRCCSFLLTAYLAKDSRLLIFGCDVDLVCYYWPKVAQSISSPLILFRIAIRCPHWHDWWLFIFIQLCHQGDQVLYLHLLKIHIPPCIKFLIAHHLVCKIWLIANHISFHGINIYCVFYRNGCMVKKKEMKKEGVTSTGRPAEQRRTIDGPLIQEGFVLVTGWILLTHSEQRPQV